MSGQKVNRLPANIGECEAKADVKPARLPFPHASLHLDNMPLDRTIALR
jgi:hypothetical protein